MTETEIKPDTKRVWRQAAVITNGKNIPVGNATFLTANGDGYTITVNGKVYQKGTVRNDLSQTPPQSDVFVSEGPQAGETVRQIFKVEGDVLVACSGGPGGARPTDFTSRPGSGQTLSVWLQVDNAAVQPPFWKTWPFWLIILLVSNPFKELNALHKDLDPVLGYGGTLVAGGALMTAIITAIAALAKLGWRMGLTIGVGMSTALITFQELNDTLRSALGSLGAITVSASTAFVAGLLASALVARLLKTNA